MSWLVEFIGKLKNGKKIVYSKEIYIVSPELDVLRVRDMVKNANPPKTKFTIQQIDVGVFKLKNVTHSYTGDGRKLTNTKRIAL
jgi:hypothetical protein